MTHEMKQLVRAAQRAGLNFRMGSKHGRIEDPRTGRFVTISNTPRCPYAADNARRDVRKHLGVSLS